MQNFIQVRPSCSILSLLLERCVRTSFVGTSCPLRTSPVEPGGPPFLSPDRPVVLKSGRNRRYRPVARPVTARPIVGRAVTNQVSGPRPSGHFPAPTLGPRRSTVSLVLPADRGPSRPREGFLLPPPRRRSSAALRRGNSTALSRGFPFMEAHSQPPSMPRCPCILGPPRRSLSRRVRAERLA